MSVEFQAIIFGVAVALFAWTAWKEKHTGWLGLAVFVLVFFWIAADAALD